MPESNKRATWIREYLKPLVGCTITKVDANVEDELEVWPAIQVTTKLGQVFNLEISQDEDGNGPGFIFGLPTPQPMEK